ncbi:predicted protein [Histoplasma mississippiense (nom. inval.)]|uniref:predicted protein n=1 Tax=Ajellomyces capsulatus (strain NAm1 / WU24) TaxID=2059318 RepID=UPI000157C18C|nr:predicted protein [Histoplasma mississippiense (nom. inval.)]EDN08019.1 predicted protein [Histoplasma mississippiense (nom. inval.)]
MLSGKGYSCICQNPDSPLEAQRPEPRQHCLVHGRLVRRNPAYIFNLQIRAASHFALVLAPAPASESRSCTPCRLLLCNPVIEVWDGKRRVVASSLDEYYIVYTNEFAEVLSYRTEVKVKGLLKCSKSTSEWSRTGLPVKRTEKPETETAWQTATRGPSQHSTVSDVDER